MTTQLLKKGDTRTDGFRFVGYEKRRGKVREKWLNPETFQRLKDGPIGPQPLVAWLVTLNEYTMVTFAMTKSAAKWNAVGSYWDAYGKYNGWPSVSAVRKPEYDKVLGRLYLPTYAAGWRHCFDEQYIRDMV